MVSNVLKVGDRIELKRYSMSNEEDSNNKLYMSQLLDIVGSDMVNISVPLESGHLVPLEIGERYELRFISLTGIFICKGEIMNRYKQNSLYFLVVKILSDLRKDQRRKYYRLDKIRPLKYHTLADAEMRIYDELTLAETDLDRRDAVIRLKDICSETNFEGTMSNISGGGIKFHSDKPLEKGSIIRLSFRLEDTDVVTLDLLGRVVASEYVTNGNLHNEHRIEFVYINRDTRERIVQYVFAEDRKRRQKENGLF